MTHTLARLLFLMIRNSRTRGIIESVSNFLHFKSPVAVKVGRHVLFARRFDRIVVMILSKYGLLEKRESRLMNALIQPGMKVVDIGANIGYYTTLFSEWVGAHGRVYAFEPECENFAMLSLAVKHGGITNIVLERAGVGSHTGTNYMYINPIHAGDHRMYDACRFEKRVEIQMFSLDDYLVGEERVRFIKMDIQGGEYFALQGMKKTLAQQKEIALFTQLEPLLLHEAGCSPRLFMREVMELGFHCRVLDKKVGTRLIREPDELLELGESEKSIDALFIKE